MAPKIRELVSNLTYDGSLFDAEEILTRRYSYSKIRLALPDIDNNTVVVYSHNDRETKVYYYKTRSM